MNTQQYTQPAQQFESHKFFMPKEITLVTLKINWKLHLILIEINKIFYIWAKIKDLFYIK